MRHTGLMLRPARTQVFRVKKVGWLLSPNVKILISLRGQEQPCLARINVAEVKPAAAHYFFMLVWLVVFLLLR